MNFDVAYEKFSPLWNQPNRFHHTVENHLNPMLRECDFTHGQWGRACGVVRSLTETVKQESPLL